MKTLLALLITLTPACAAFQHVPAQTNSCERRGASCTCYKLNNVFYKDAEQSLTAGYALSMDHEQCAMVLSEIAGSETVEQ